MSGELGEAAGGATVVRAVGLAKTYPAVARGGGAGDGAEVTLFRGLEMEVRAGEMVAVLGRSGAGKSSLLHLLAGLERPTAGEVWVAGQALHALRPEALAEVRNRRIGYVWQFHYLLPEFSAVENVAMPLLARGEGRRAALREAERGMERVGLGGRAGHRPGELSGGEQQRVAMARALVTGPAVLLADEPTGDLDDETAGQLFRLMAQMCREERLAAVMVTHHEEIAGRCDRRLRLVEGRLEAA